MGRDRIITDDGFDRMLDGHPQERDRLPELSRFVDDLRGTFPADPLLPESLHVSAMIRAAHLGTHGEADDATPSEAGIAWLPVRKRTTMKDKMFGRTLVTRGLAAVIAVFTVMGGLAFAGALPDPLQGAASNAAGVFGLTIDDGSEDADTTETEGDDQGEDGQSDDQGEDDQGDVADDQGDQGGNEQSDDQGDDTPAVKEDDQGEDDQGEDDEGDTGPGPSPAPAVEPPVRGVPAPVLGETVVVQPGRGSVLVRRPGARRFRKLAGAALLPSGTVIDARRGRIRLTTALDGTGAFQTGRFWGSRFQVRQSAKGAGMTSLALRGGDFGRCPARSSALAHASVVPRENPTTRRVVRRLWARDHGGRFRTYGNNSVATARGTAWVTQDRCDGTVTRVREGAVAVTNRRTGRTRIVRAGHAHLVRR
jgi:hypothetical protein